MFITAKRAEREKQELLDASNRLTDAILEHTDQGVFMLDVKGKIQPRVSRALAGMFRREEFANVTLDQLLAPLVSAKTLAVVRHHWAALSESAPGLDALPNPLADVEVRFGGRESSGEAAHYAFEFSALRTTPRLWLVRVADVTLRVHTGRELEDLRAQIQIQGEILRSVLHHGGAGFAALLQRIDASMKAINLILKKPAREEEAFRHKLEEALDEVDRVRRDAAAFQLGTLEGAARQFEDSLHELHSRRALSGSDFLPLAVKLDQIYGQFVTLKSLTASAGPPRDAVSPSRPERMTENGTQIIEAPKFLQPPPRPQAVPGAHRSAPAGSLENTLRALTDHVAQEYAKSVQLDCTGLALVPAQYQASIKNIAIQLIRNAVMHGIENAQAREAAGKPAQGTLRLEFKCLPEEGFELLFEDDGCGLDPDEVRATAIARGVISGEGAARLRDREAIKLIFKSGYSTLPSAPGEAAHGTGMSLVRRYVHEAGGKIALASLIGHETRFKVTLPPVAAASAAAEA